MKTNILFLFIKLKGAESNTCFITNGNFEIRTMEKRGAENALNMILKDEIFKSIKVVTF